MKKPPHARIGAHWRLLLLYCDLVPCFEYAEGTAYQQKYPAEVNVQHRCTGAVERKQADAHFRICGQCMEQLRGDPECIEG